jgi:hypothetical protein
LNNQDLKSIINTACKYNDIEVLEKIASSKIIKTAGVRDLLQGLGLQMSQTSNESQFKDKSALTSFIASSSTIDDKEAARDIYSWWAQKIKEVGTSDTNITVTKPTGGTRQVSFEPKRCIREDSLRQIYNELPTGDIHNRPAVMTLISSAPMSVFVNPSDPPTRFNQTLVDDTGAPLSGMGVTITTTPYTLPLSYINIKKNSGTELGFLDYLISDLNTTPPTLNDNVHVKIFDVLNSAMTNRAMSSMIRKNAIAETPRAGLISNWKYIVSLPQEIENRMAKTPKNIMDYKQKLALKKYGRDLSQVLNHRVQFVEYVYNNPAASAGTGVTSTATGLNTQIPFYKINELSNNYFADPLVVAQVDPLLKRTGELLNKIIPELDKDTSLTRKILKTVVTPSDYLNSRGKEFH